MTEIIFDKNEDWEKRILCSDESCIGTIGPDGKCRECGKSYEGELPAGQGASSEQTVTAEEQKTVPSTDTDSGDDWDKRILCLDESCIGTIGPDGFCRECGAYFRSEPVSFFSEVGRIDKQGANSVFQQLCNQLL